MRGGLTPEAISLIPVSWKTAVDITHSSGGYIFVLRIGRIMRNASE
jgi:hypothetical protein